MVHVQVLLAALAVQKVLAADAPRRRCARPRVRRAPARHSARRHPALHARRCARAHARPRGRGRAHVRRNHAGAEPHGGRPGFRDLGARGVGAIPAAAGGGGEGGETRTVASGRECFIERKA